jgi:hypothetical protein
MSIGIVQRLVSMGNVAIFNSLSARHPPSIVSVTLHNKRKETVRYTQKKSMGGSIQKLFAPMAEQVLEGLIHAAEDEKKIK